MSTAFERWVIERADHHVVDEPFSAAYYLGPERVSDRYGLEEPGATGDEVLATLAALSTPAFVKDMVHHVPAHLRDAVAGLGGHTLLTRDPRRAIPSFAEVWPDVTWEECGYEALVEFATTLERTGRPYDVVDADDLARTPGPTLAAWCERQGLPFDPATLHWQPGVPTEWTRWLEFHTSATRSTGFRPHEPGPLPSIDDDRIAALVERAEPLHRSLVERAATS